jgi:hypothetical protein
MNIRTKEVQHGWGITVSKAIFDSLSLTTNAGAIGVEVVGDSQVKLSTSDEAQFKRWRAVLDDAGCAYKTFEPSVQ